MAERLPNIVLILADDLGYGDVSCLNSQSRIVTRTSMPWPARG